ncbi:MYND-type zinc finger-containing chromatin reader ZMYND8-like [Phymastichus coffea]|uniref:MYND-type zinc finger-containing chromatin reader ZMYND8-like n=1 Tax=Phymastichus coffea TaxID=108790 RepID=UPI00273C06BF|nr:MYND-type zinc finger-containing chromatin reader ZMYND8-like [Phymastichus coffea]XP_058792010.1 MYND-type zinc finger-containing chromatin reader ZMYND8-like [Phymastichus coffea]XP_058792011.1 MYND-type zinc finger-containing chromatin reader ZMYND8-like [Phymastichus coffea]XP_058792012.1 MYND-type zinc finger-containing chromatin reader ZMYND8-like [Phymastichus coffea]XP_058792013.1 MYND-type zinc finger-containing chromatin reader ZMYND8-like [Phymastichus coffea]
MESNENSEKKTLDASNAMEIEEPNVQDKSEKQSKGTNIEKVIAKQDKASESKDITSIKSNDVENTPAESEKLDDGKINTPSNAAEGKKDNELPSNGPKIVKDTDNVQVDTPTPAVTPVASKEGKRKRKSTNPSPETTVAPTPVPQSVAVAAAEEQNGSNVGKRKKADRNCDKYCWRCHKESVEMQCSACPRSWHRRCMGGAPPLSVNNWICGECVSILQAENAETRSPVMADLTVDQLCMMLRHVVERMRDQHGSEPFWRAVDLDDVPNYLDYVVKPMDLNLLESNVRAKLYGSTDAFMADAKWIQHNCIVFNTYTSKLTNTAKQMLKIARQEVSEIETCPDCFARGRNLPRPLSSWFIEPCRKPHPIVWAKLKGFPFWPAKAMSRLNAQGLVDVRFFGEHDRAWVSPKDIYLYSQEPPAQLPKKKKLEMEQCVIEVEEHIQKLKQIVGEFRYSSPKVPYDPHDPMQIQKLLPDYDPSGKTKSKTVKTDTNKQQTPVQSPVTNKVTSPKTEKKPPISKNLMVSSTNGIIKTPSVEKRKFDRKRKSVETVQEAVNKVSPEAPSEIVINNKSRSKSPPAIPALTNKSISDNGSTSNSESRKNNKSPEVSVIEVTNDTTPKRIITAVRKLKSDNIKKIKLVKNHEKEEIKKAITAPKSTNSNQTNLIKVYRPVNNLQNNSDAANDVSPSKKSKTIYIQSKAQMTGTATKIVTKNVLADHKVVGKALFKSACKDGPRIILNSSQKILKDGTPNNKPMTAIPISARKDQTKAMFLQLNSSASESARHFSEKEARLNVSMPVIKQEPKDDVVQPKLTITRKPGKARKSLPNKPPVFPQVVTSTPLRSVAKTSSTLSDAMTHIPPASAEARASSSELPPPEAGPVSAKIHDSSKELANRMAELIVETIKSTAENGELSINNTVSNHEATIQLLKLRIERLKWEHQQEIAEIRHNNDLVIREMKTSMDFERFRALQEAKREAELEKQRCIEETKRKQWCVVCGREAMFYCCWNTAYCDYPCQQKHWSSHIATCAQKSQKSSSSSNTPSTQQQKPPQQQPKPVSETTANGQQNGNISDEIRLPTGSV